MTNVCKRDTPNMCLDSEILHDAVCDDDDDDDDDGVKSVNVTTTATMTTWQCTTRSWSTSTTSTTNSRTWSWSHLLLLLLMIITVGMSMSFVNALPQQYYTEMTHRRDIMGRIRRHIDGQSDSVAVTDSDSQLSRSRLSYSGKTGDTVATQSIPEPKHSLSTGPGDNTEASLSLLETNNIFLGTKGKANLKSLHNYIMTVAVAVVRYKHR
jgi:hypothetical protein